MNLTAFEINEYAKAVARNKLMDITANDVHEYLDRNFGAVSDADAWQIADLAQNAEVVL